MNSAGGCTEGDVQTKGHNLHYLEWGNNGEDIIFLHGLGHYAWAHNFDPFCASLSKDYHIIAFDLLGHGDSDDPKKPIGYGEHAEIIRQGVRELGLTRYVLWGYSFGGRISMFYADRYPEEVSKVILVDIGPESHQNPEQVNIEPNVPYSFIDEEEALDWFISRNRGIQKEEVRPLVDILFKQSSDGRLLLPSHVSRKVNLRRSGDGWSVLNRLTMPVQLIRGSESPYTTEDIVSRMSEVNPGLMVRTIEGAGHTVPFTHSEEFMEAVRGFLKE
jgi:pimeloyl-ACP methyl ester carboxylesterase